MQANAHIELDGDSAAWRKREFSNIPAERPGEGHYIQISNLQQVLHSVYLGEAVLRGRQAQQRCEFE